jgi:hypothetical protein
MRAIVFYVYALKYVTGSVCAQLGQLENFTVKFGVLFYG